MIAVAVVGIVFLIVSLFVPWFTFNTEVRSYRYGLFKQALEIDFPIQLLQSFAIITLILAFASCVLFVLHSLGVIKIKWAYLIACSVIVTLFAILTFIFTILVAKQYYSHYLGVPLMGGVIPSVGAWFLLIGTLISWIPLLFNRLKK